MYISICCLLRVLPLNVVYGLLVMKIGVECHLLLNMLPMLTFKSAGFVYLILRLYFHITMVMDGLHRNCLDDNSSLIFFLTFQLHVTVYMHSTVVIGVFLSFGEHYHI